MLKKLLAVLIIGATTLACSDNDDNAFTFPKESTVQNFMWQGLNQWYFWQKEAPNLGDNRFANNEDYNVYLEQYTDPEEFFYQTCYMHNQIVGQANAIDRFSFVSDNYKTLVNSLDGISKSHGMEFGLVRFDGSSDIFGYVKYIIPNSDAATKDIARGDIFSRVNGTKLTDTNYAGLLFGQNDTYTLGMADISGHVVTDNDREVTLTKMEGLIEDPILVAKTVEVGGTKIAYLMYNGFTSSFNEELNSVFGQFKSEGATELVLDLRYNTGGSVESSRSMAISIL